MKSHKKVVSVGASLCLVAAALVISSVTVSSAAAKPTKPKIPVPAALKAALSEPTWAEVLKADHFAPLATKPPTGVSFYFIYSGLGSGVYIQAAFQQAATDLGWNFTTLTYNGANPASIEPLFLTAINAGAKAIVYDGENISQLTSVFAAAQAAHVAILTHFNTDPENATNNALETQTFNDQIDTAAISKIAGEEIEQLLGKHAHIVVVGTNAISTVDTVDALYQSDLKLGCPGCSTATLNVPVGDFGSANTSQDVITYLRLHPSTNFVFFSYGLSESGLRSALNNAGFKKVLIGGNSANASNNAELVYGADSFWVEEPYDLAAWVEVDAIARLVEGGNVAQYSADSYPVWVVTKGHIPFNVTQNPVWPRGFEAGFLSLWKASS